MELADVSRVPAVMLEDVWAQVAPLIEASFQPYTDETISEVKENILRDRYQLWVAFAPAIVFAAVTMLIDRKREIVLHVEYAGAVRGTIDLWKAPVVLALTDFARAHGAVALECAGRAGWMKIFPDAKVVSVKIRKEI